MNIALIAHDNSKEKMIQFTRAYQRYLEKHNLYATGTTGARIQQKVKLDIHLFRSGPLGGDQEIGAMAANNELDMVIFFRDPLTPQPHDPGISALMRLCDVYDIPLATNMGSAEILIRSLDRGDLEWRNVIREDKEKELLKKSLFFESVKSNIFHY
ncbi:methylglyoxal synthase [Saliterribacillus persicus]|uniref:Methylglyoxal synthase n=1 Tax=Saliterribacillus persicus TaxID=930114 RepID=A0A368YFP1_9BACI|nr:methylglyoxal synthase [Saliterribacillus persicus]RCW77004.1 methylglyoxal synthase [Saliterribacillus persicus]